MQYLYYVTVTQKVYFYLLLFSVKILYFLLQLIVSIIATKLTLSRSHVEAQCVAGFLGTRLVLQTATEFWSLMPKDTAKQTTNDRHENFMGLEESFGRQDADMRGGHEAFHRPRS
jgi:hypothetical protein